MPRAANYSMHDGYLLQLSDSDGRFASVRQISSSGYAVPGTVAVAGGQVFIAGRYSGTAQFDTGGSQAVTMTSQGVCDAFIAQVIPDTGAIFGQVYNDFNKDSVNNDEMAALAGWTVNLLDSGGNHVQTTTTDVRGGYSFHGVSPGTYTVREVSQRAGTRRKEQPVSR